MADKNTGWACTHSASIIGEDDVGVVIRVICYWQNQGWRYDISNVNAWVICNGSWAQVLTAGAVDTSGLANTAAHQLGYYDFYIAKNYGWQNISCYAQITSNSTYVSGTKSSSASTVGFSAKTSYVVSYNLNGGNGSFPNQTKWFNEGLALHSASPTRSYYNFVRWNTNTANTGTGYDPGVTYNGNAGLTLYAIWNPYVHTIKYDANGGSGAPSDQTKTYGVQLSISSTIPKKTNYNFLGWSTTVNGSVVYKPGEDYGNDINGGTITLYAVWELAYVKPRITNFTANRCDVNGNDSDTGTYIRVSFDWATDNTVSAIEVRYKEQSATEDWDGGPLTYSGTTSGNVNQAVGQGLIDTEKSYHVRVFVKDGDSDDYKTDSATLSIGTVKFPIDIKAEGKGVAIGKVAEEEDLFDVDFEAKFRKGVTINQTCGTGNISIAGTIVENTPFDDVGEDQQLRKSGLYTMVVDSYYWYHLINLRHRNGYGDGLNYGMQIRHSFDATLSLETRLQHAGTWSDWHQIYKAKTIYDNASGTTGAVELYESSASFKFLDILFVVNDGGQRLTSKKIARIPVDPNVNNNIFDNYVGSSYTYLYNKYFNVNGTSIYVHKNRLIAQGATERNQEDNATYMYITKVIGYR